MHLPDWTPYPLLLQPYSGCQTQTEDTGGCRPLPDCGRCLSLTRKACRMQPMASPSDTLHSSTGHSKDLKDAADGYLRSALLQNPLSKLPIYRLSMVWFHLPVYW